MESKRAVAIELIKYALDNHFRFGNLIKAPTGFRYHSFKVEGGDVLGYGVEVQYVMSISTGSEFITINFDFSTLILSKKFMVKLLKNTDDVESHAKIARDRAYANGINEAIDYLKELINPDK